MKTFTNHDETDGSVQLLLSHSLTDAEYQMLDSVIPNIDYSEDAPDENVFINVGVSELPWTIDMLVSFNFTQTI